MRYSHDEAALKCISLLPLDELESCKIQLGAQMTDEASYHDTTTRLRRSYFKMSNIRQRLSLYIKYVYQVFIVNVSYEAPVSFCRPGCIHGGGLSA